MKAPHTKRIDAFHQILPKHGEMRVDAHLFVSSKIPVESEALDQLADAACLPGVSQVIATPDIHVGFGVPIGAVLGAKDFVSPAAVGYDINCGMRLLTTPWNANEVDVKSLASSVRKVIPLGEGKSNIRLNGPELERTLEQGVFGLLKVLRGKLLREIEDQKEIGPIDLEEEQSAAVRIERQGSFPGNPGAVSDRAKERGLPQLGTLGGGNHFIEFQIVEAIEDPACAALWGLRLGQLVVMIHSGSRGLGHEVGGDYMRLARHYDQDHSLWVPSGNLAILPLDSKPGKDYLGAMNAAANYAFANREMMSILVKGVIRRDLGFAELPTVYDVAHNLASFEQHQGQELLVHRKGATRAFCAERMAATPFADQGQPVLVPGSMGTASWLLRGIPQGAKTLFSTNHGAGRVMSRTAAVGKRRGRRGKGSSGGAISDQQFRESMSGVFLICEDQRMIKEEAPAAYKDIDAVIETVVGAEMAAPVARMVPLAVLKG